MNKTTPTPIMSEQLRALWATARQLGMDSDDLHARARAQTGKEHLRDLTCREAYALLDGLKGRRRPEPPPDRASQEQIKVIFGLACRLGWLVDENGAPSKARLTAFVAKRFGVDELDWMTPETATKVTEALKAMIAGGRGERKGGNANGTG